MSDDVKRWQDGTDMAGHAIYVVPAADFDRVVAERDAARRAKGRALRIVDKYGEPIELAARIAALEEAGDALAAAALGADRQVAAWRAVRNREEA